jgi:peroxidase
MRRLILTSLFLASIALLPAQAVRTYDGSANNLSHPEWSSANSSLKYWAPNGYADSIAAPAGTNRPMARQVSNLIFNQDQSVPNPYGISDFGWAFGQFMDHDLSFVPDEHTEPAMIPIPAFDPYFDPNGEGNKMIPMARSAYDLSSGTNASNPRRHINEITGWIDASNVYGSDTVSANWLRTFQGGKLKTSSGGFLPYNTTTGEFNDPVDPNAPFMLIEGANPPKHFIAGDLRANEQPVLACMHTLFVREHNRVCDSITNLHPGWTDEQIYQKARKLVNAEFAAIAYEEWLPALGIELPPYTGYDPNVDPRIMNVFSAAAFRLGHTLVSSDLKRLNNDGSPSSYGDVSLKDAFFNPFLLTQEGGLEPFFNGMVTQPQQNFDHMVISDLRNFLFGQPGQGGLDLISINLQRGRERGLVDYNQIRQAFGLAAVTDFDEITSNPNLANTLEGLYGSVNNIDPWVGMLSEDHRNGSAIGETIHAILSMQFQKLRDGDRFYYENDPAFSAYRHRHHQSDPHGRYHPQEYHHSLCPRQCVHGQADYGPGSPEAASLRPQRFSQPAARECSYPAAPGSA